MKYLYTLLLLSLFTSSLLLAQPVIEWQKSLGGSSGDRVSCLIQTTVGDYVALGSTRSTDGQVLGNHGMLDCWIVKLDPQGNILRKRTYGAAWDDSPSEVIETTDGGFIVAGNTKSNDSTAIQPNAWILKLDFNLNLEWEKSIGTIYENFANSIVQTTDGGYLFVGQTQYYLGQPFNYWMVKLDHQGILQWEKQMGGANNDVAKIIRTTEDGGYIVAGITESHDGDVTGYHGSIDIWVIKFDALGNTEWDRAYGGNAWEYAPDIIQTQDGGYILTCASQSVDGDIVGHNHGDSDFWIVKLDPNGDITWQKSMGGSDIDQAWGVDQMVDGGYVVAGVTYSNDGDVQINHNPAEYWVIKLDPTGNLEWNKTMGGNLSDWVTDVIATNDGGTLIGGYAYNGGDITGNHGSTDFWIVKLGSTTTQTEALNNPVWQLSPNPTTSIFQIAGEDPGNIKSVSISNLIGKPLAIWTSAKIDISSLSAGLYTVTIQTKDGKVTQRKIVKQ